MEKPLNYIFAYAILFVALTKTSSNLITDQSALVALKDHITFDPFHLLSKNWTNSSSVCNWIGVTCGLRHRRVTALSLFNMSLSGTIPSQLGNLSFLTYLNLGYNLLSGTLPRELSLLRRLKYLSLKVNNFRGVIPPWFGLIRKLEHLSLSNNSFTGHIPNSLSNLSNLQLLELRSNYLVGEIPQVLGSLHNLQVLNLQSNSLSGPIRSSIFNISTLQIIALTSNKLSGTLPIDMCINLPSLQGIFLSYNQLNGQIPPNISQCSQLQFLSLSYNSFTGQIAPEIGMLKSLQILFLGRNNLSGIIPREVGNLESLAAFEVDGNQFTGTIPLSVSNMSSLRTLRLENNKLSGNIQRDIGNLTMLNYLDLQNNLLTGVLPREIAQLYQLEDLGIGFNNITSSIPPEFFNMSALRIISLTNNSLYGHLPINLCHGSPVLEGLFLSANYLSGEIPKSISNCSNLRTLELGSNKFTSFVPHFCGSLRLLERLHLANNNLTEPSFSKLSFINSLPNCTSLIHFWFYDNPLNSTIPASIGNLSSSIQTFSARNCKIKGIIPTSIGNISNLVRLDLSDNELSGNIPITVKHLHNLQGLFLTSNNLEGSIQDGLCELSNLVQLNLSHNHLSGPIPECLGNVSSLRHIFLDSNMLSSSIPSSLWHLKDLLMLDLSSNSFSGFLPQEIGNLVAAVYINLSMNHLSESIPSTIGNLQVLVNLSLAHNRLEGSIPLSMGSMISLVALDLSYNNLSGLIPKSLEALQHLRNFNVSFNDLSGEIPDGGPFRNFVMDSFKGNKALCGIPRFNVPFCRSASSHGSIKKKVRSALFIIVGVVTFITAVYLAFILKRYTRKDKVENSANGLVSTAPERISHYELLQATEQFNESNLLGIGSFGSVYKGILRDGKVFAVKVFNLQLEAAFKSFDVECDVLRNIRHRNLTKVISSCSNIDFKALVLEYMPKGNLERWLYSHNYCLETTQRMNIMIDVACALEYLHHGYSIPIVHCDLKPSNVLLDEEMVAHVSDFGIAKLLGDGESIVLTNTLATLGYIAPEYGFEGLVSTRSDVYSYGVMLMETFTRKRPSDVMFVGDLSLKSWIESSLKESPSHVIDANLLVNLEEDGIEKNVQCASSVLELALKCSAESPRDRIDMKEALSELQKIKSKFFR